MTSELVSLAAFRRSQGVFSSQAPAQYLVVPTLSACYAGDGGMQLRYEVFAKSWRATARLH